MISKPKNPDEPKRGPARGKDCWRTPLETVMLWNRIYGGTDPRSYVPDLWKREDGKAIYLQCLVEIREQGAIELDVCADRDDQYHYAAENLALTGLETDMPWVGKSVANPPYSETATWVQRGVEMVQASPDLQLMFLIPPGITNNYWIDLLLEPPESPPATLFATCRGRLSFLDDDGPVRNNPQGSAIVGWVDDLQGARAELRRAGWVVHRPA